MPSPRLHDWIVRRRVPLIAGGIALAMVLPAAVRIAGDLGGPANAGEPAPAPRPAAPRPHAPRPVAAASSPKQAGYAVRRVLDIPGPMRIGDYVWDERGAPAAGRIVITVDIAAGVLSVFRDGYEIGAAAIMYGADDHPTPLGVFAISQKDARHVSNLYDAPMPYMMRLTNDGVSIHGANMRRDGATHGCVSVPIEFARRIFAQVRVGDRVIVTNGERLGMGERIGAA